VDDLGESLLSFVERQQVLSFPKKPAIAIARNAFDPGNLPYLENIILDDHTSDVTISFEDGKLKQSKSVGKASTNKSPAIWSKNFITYVRVVSVFHGVQHPQIVNKLLDLHNTIVELSQTYDRQKAVLPLALLQRQGYIPYCGRFSQWLDDNSRGTTTSRPALVLRVRCSIRLRLLSPHLVFRGFLQIRMEGV
jgi:hypothetical protein